MYGSVFDIESVMYMSLPMYKRTMEEEFGLGHIPLLEIISSQIDKVTEDILKYDEWIYYHN